MKASTSLFLDYQNGNNRVEDPGAGGRFQFNNVSHGVTTLTATGNYTLPDCAAGTTLLVCCDDTSTITLKDAAGATFHVFNGTSGTTSVLCTATDGNSWGATRLDGRSVAFGTAEIYTQLTSTQGFIPLPLTGWREVTTNDITNAAGNGGVLATDTTPTLEYVNGDTDSQIRILWATSNVDPIATQITLPPDLDRTADIVLRIRGTASGDNDEAGMTADAFFDEGDTKVEDSTPDGFTLSGGVVNNTITIAAADIPDTATTMSIELTPEAHANDTISIYATWLTYTKKLLTS